MKRGFTLIELLAVIVILAIIALIATPIILGIIDSTGNEAIERSVENYLKAANMAIAKENLNREFKPNICEVKEDGSLLCDDETESILVEIDGNHPTYGTIIFENGNVSGYANLKMDENTYVSKETDVEDGTLYTGIIYRNSQGSVNIGDTIDVSSYTTNITNISQSYYLKHKVVNNVVTASYACITYTENGVRKDVCLRGGDSSYYASNQEILRGVEPYFNTLDYNGSKGACRFYDSFSDCHSDSLNLHTIFDDTVSAHNGSVACIVDSDGYSACF